MKKARGSNTFQILNEKEIIANMDAGDAKMIGYMVASEEHSLEKEQKEKLLQKSNAEND